MRLVSAVLLLFACAPAAHAAPILQNGPARTQAQENAGTLIALGLSRALRGDGDLAAAAGRYLANDFRNHDVEQPSGAQAFARYFVRPVPAISPGRVLFAISDDDLTMVAEPGETDPAQTFNSALFELKNGRVTQMWVSGRADPAMVQTAGGTSRGAAAEPVQVPAAVTAGVPPGVKIMVPSGQATRAERDANLALVQGFITDFFVKGNDRAAALDLAPDLRSHVAGVPSGHDFAVIARKHQDKVVATSPQTQLFALADGELVAIGFPVPYAGDPGAGYTQSVARVRAGKIVEWWYSGAPTGRSRRVWRKPKREQPAPPPSNLSPSATPASAQSPAVTSGPG